MGAPAWEETQEIKDAPPAWEDTKEAAQDSKPGLLKQGLTWTAKQFNRVPAAIRGSVQAFQNGDPRSLVERNPVAMAWQGLKDPESVQSSEQMMANLGASAEQNKPQIRTPAPGPQFNFQTRDFTPAKPDTAMTSTAKELGAGFDAIAPTGLEGLPVFLAAGMKAAGKTISAPVKVAALTADAIRGGTEAKDALTATKQGLQNYGTRQAAKVGEVMNPKLAPDADAMKQIGQSIGLTPEELQHPAIEFGQNSVQARRQKVLAQGEGGGPALEQHNAMTEKIQRGFDNAVHAIGGQPMEPVQAGEMIRDGVKAGAKRIAESVSASHNDIIDQFPGLAVNGAEADAIESKLNGIEKFAKGRAVRGLTSEHQSAAKSLLQAVEAARSSNGSYKQLNEAREMAGEVAFGDVGAIGKIPEYQQRMRDLYFTLNDALVNTVGKLDKVRAGQFRVPGANFEPLKAQLIESNKTLHDMFQDEGAVGRALGDNQKAPEQIFNQALLYGDTRKVQALKNLLSPEQFQAAKGAYINALVKRGKDAFTYKAAKNALAQNRSVVSELFADAPQELKPVKDVIDLGDRVGAPLLPGSAGQLDFGGANTLSKLVHKVIEPAGDITAEMGKVRARQGVPGNWENLKNLPVYQAAKMLRLEESPNNLPPYFRGGQ